MSPLEPSWLVRRGGELIVDDQPCDHCGYNLKGLQTIDLCPECGEPISFLDAPTGLRPYKPGKALRDSGRMLDAPRAYLRFVAAAFRLVAIGGLVMFGSAIYLFFRPSVEGAVIGLLGSLTWTIGAVGVCIPRQLGPVRHPIDTKKEWRVERAVTVATQPLWMLAFACVLPMFLIDAPAGPLRVGAVVGALAAALGIIALFVQLMNLSHWAGDTALAFRLGRNAWLVGLAVLLAIPLALGSLGLFSLWAYPRDYPLLWLFVALAGAVVALALPTLVTLIDVWRLGASIFGDMDTADNVEARRQARFVPQPVRSDPTPIEHEPERPVGSEPLNPYELEDE